MTPALIHIQPYDIQGAARIDVRIGSSSVADAYGLGGVAWAPSLTERPQMSFETMSADLDGKVMAGRSRFSFNMRGAGIQDRQLKWVGAPTKIYSASALKWPAVTELDGIVVEQAVDDDTGICTLSVEASTDFLEGPLLIVEFDGSGGLGGDADMRGTFAPAGFGPCENIEPVWFDKTRWIGMIDGYYNTTAITRLMEGLDDRGASVGDYANYALLALAIDSGAVAPGRWATCIAQGLVGLGAPPVAPIGVNATFGYSKVGSIMKRVLLTHRGVVVGNIDGAAFDQMDVDVPYTAHYWTKDQRDCKDLLEALARSINATPLVTFQNKVTVSRAVVSAPVAELVKGGAVPPRVLDVKNLPMTKPVWRLRARSARPANVLTYDQVLFKDTIEDKGQYDAGETYRAGHIVWKADKSSWLYINDTPTAGNAPPNWPVTANAYWENMTPPASASTLTYADGTPLENLKPGEAGADVTGGNTAAAIVSQGALATQNTADWRTQILARPAINELFYDFSYPSWGGTGGAAAAGWAGEPPGQFSMLDVANSPGGKVLVMGDGTTSTNTRIFGPEYVSYNAGDLYEVSFDIEIVSAPDAGTTYYLGVQGIDKAGNNLGGSYNYVAASGLSQNAVVGTRFIKKGYFTGFTNSSVSGQANDPLSPAALPDGSAFTYGQGGVVAFRPVVYMNYNGKRGQTRVHAIRVVRIPARLATQDEVSFGAVTLKESAGGSTATLTNFKTSLGTAAAILSQGALATLNDVDWKTKVVGVGKPANNAGTAKLLVAFGNYSTVTANSVSKSGGTHGAFEGGAVGVAYKDAVFISSSIVTSPTWRTYLALDPISAANTNTGGAGVWVALLWANATDRTLVVYKAGVIIGSWTIPGVATVNDRFALMCNGVRVFAMFNGAVYGGDTSAYNATPGTTYWPKVFDFYNTGSVGNTSIDDIQYGAWTDVRTFLGDGVTALAQAAYKTDEGTAAAIIGQGPGATAPGTDVLNSYAPYGQNLIPLSDQAAGTIFFLYNNPDGMTLNYPVAWAVNGFSGWTTSTYILGGNIKASVAYQSGRVASPTFGYANFGFLGINGDKVNDIAWTVAPGDRLIASCYMHHHRCGANLMVRLIDSTGANPNLDYSVSTTGAGEGGYCYSLSQYERIYKLVTVPAGYNICQLYVQKQNTAVGQADSYLWWAAPMLERAAPNQTTPSPYQPGPPTGTLAGKTNIDLGSGDVVPNGGIPPTIPDNGFTYTATVSSITISWPTMTVYRSNGTTISIASGSQSCTALSSAYNWKFYPYIVDTGGSTATIQFAAAQGSPGSYYGTQQIAYLTQGSVAAKAYVNQLGRIDMGAFNAATTSGGTGGGGGGGWNCLHESMTLGNKSAGEIEVGDLVETPTGVAPIAAVRRWKCAEWFEIWSGADLVAKVTRRHLFYRASDGEEIAAEDVKLGDILSADGDHIFVTGLVLCHKEAEAIGIGIEDPHLHFAGSRRILCHNGTQKP